MGAGVALVAVAAVIGGLLGIAVRARESATELAAAQRMMTLEDRAPARLAAAAEEALAPAPPLELPAPPATPPVVAAAPPSPPPAAESAVAPAPRPIAPAPAAPRVFAAPRHKPSGGGKASSPPKARDDGYKVASSGFEEPKEPKEAKPSKPAREDAEPKRADKPAKPSKTLDEADRVLKAAMGATENTL